MCVNESLSESVYFACDVTKIHCYESVMMVYVCIYLVIFPVLDDKPVPLDVRI